MGRKSWVPYSPVPSIHIDLDNYSVYRDSIHRSINIDKFDIYEDCLPTILKYLSKYSVRASFFVVGRDVNRSRTAQKMLRKAIKQGHEIGNHTMNHLKNFINLDVEKRSKEISECHEILQTKLGIKPTSYRAPGYAFRRDDIEILSELGYKNDFSRTSVVYKILTELYFITKSRRSKRFLRLVHFDMKSQSKKNLVRKFESITKVHKPIRMTNISTVWYQEMSMTKSRTSKIQKQAKPIILLHAIDFLNHEDRNSPIPALRVPLKTRLNEIEKLLTRISS